MSKRLWFRAKTYGWGWTPSSWQGWAVMLVDLAAMLGWTAYVVSHPEMAQRSNFPLVVLLPIIVLVALLLVICWLKGERPRWRWGHD